MLSAMENTYGNPSSLHRWGSRRETGKGIQKGDFGRLWGVSEDRIYFTSGGTESDNTAILGHVRP